MLNIKRATKRINETINITPLIDVIFILLLFFIVTTQFKKDAELNIVNPSSKTAVAQKIEKILVISLTADEKIFFDGKQIELLQLPEILKYTDAGAVQKAVVLNIDKKVSTGFLIAIIDECKLSGFENVKIRVNKIE
ncbi:MAG TPA: biopolymer transporter ExbD [bacterium]|nr:biopolymer transporter ExbD [bacterium]HPP86819.1 biopolymer transporter ExbD [bacterium]